MEENGEGNGKETKKKKDLLHCSYEYLNKWGDRPVFLLMNKIEKKKWK
jgi:hypothetical protein